MTEATELYRSKLVTPDEVARVIKSGDHIYGGMGLLEPCGFFAAMARRKDELENVRVYTLTGYPQEYMRPEMEGHFHTMTFYPVTIANFKRTEQPSSVSC